MLFNSFPFLFLYLPIVLVVYFWLGRAHPRWACGWLALASFFFYGYWNLRYLPLLAISIAFNYGCAIRIATAGHAERKRWLVAALAANLSLLAYYKYANFFVDSLNGIADTHWQLATIVLPVGISFFTFTQIAFLVDCYRGEARDFSLLRYSLFVSYFPHLIAGPVLHHKEMMPQFAAPENASASAAHFALGLTIFVVGLAKKTLIADNLAPLVAPVFAAGAHPPMLEAWIGALAYTFQLYFDFSGYSDMAIGLSRLFGVKLPLNFNSPYKARNIAEFWRRWHMTLSRFLRDYLYVPLGGNRRGVWQQRRNLMLTMLLGGLWHGAGWTFVLWGGLHGLYLVLYRWWQRQRWHRPGWWGAPLSFLAVVMAWVVFRAPDVATAADVAQAMLGGNGLGLPHGLAVHAHQLDWLCWFGLPPKYEGIRWIDFSTPCVPVLGLSMMLAFFAPNTQEIFRSYEPCIDELADEQHRYRWSWSPRKAWSVVVVALFFGCLLSMNKTTEFLYFQF